MKALGRLMGRFRAAVENAKQQNITAMNPEKRPEY